MRYIFNASDIVHYRFPTHTNDLLYGREDAVTTETFFVVLEPGEAPPLHMHPDVEQVFFVIAGRGELQIGPAESAERFSVGPGDVVRVPPGTFHRVLNEDASPLRYLSVDAFAGARLADEPTWDSHVRALCAANGWDFDRVKQRME